VVLPGEDGSLLKAKVDLWIAELGAETDAERTEVENAMQSQWRVDRCRNADTSAGERIQNKFEEDYDDRLEEQVQTLIPQLPENPRVILTQLENSTAGLEYVLEQFQILGQQFASNGSFETSERVHLIHLVGGRPCALFTDPVVLYIDRLNLGARHGAENVDGVKAAGWFRNERPETRSVAEFERQLEFVSQTLVSREQSRAQMEEFLVGQVARLKERLELVQLLEERDQALAQKEATIDVSPEGRLRLRYELSHLRAKDAALRQLRALQEARRKYGPDATGPGQQTAGGPAPAMAEAADSIAEDGAKVVVPAEPKPQSSPDPADGHVTASEPSSGVAEVVVAPVADATPAPAVERPAEPHEAASAVSREGMAMAPRSAAEGGCEPRKTDRTETSQVPCSTTSNAEGPAPEGGGGCGLDAATGDASKNRTIKVLTTC
jgi:hypothetical protein